MGSMHGASRPVALTGSDQVVLATSGAFGGYTLRNTTGGALRAQIYDNASAASGTLIASVGLVANASIDVSYANPVWCANGIFVHPSGAGIEGSVRVQ
jgi:hypothetical protein